MANVFDQFIDKKKANSEFFQMADGESARIINLREVKIVTKAAPDGSEKEALRLVCDVSTPEGTRTKKFDNTSQSFAIQLSEKHVVLGSAFTLTRNGVSLKTRYTISEVVNPTEPHAPQPQVAPVASVAVVESF